MASCCCCCWETWINCEASCKSQPLSNATSYVSAGTVPPTTKYTHTHARTHAHTHTHLTALCPGLPGWVGTRKVKPIWILLKQKTVSGGDHQQLNTHTYTATMHTCQHNRQQLRNTGPGVPTTTCSDEWSTAAVCAQKWIFFDCHVLVQHFLIRDVQTQTFWHP